MKNSLLDIMLEGARLNAILIAAIELKVFDHVSSDGSSAEEIASSAEISLRGCQSIADGLVGSRIWSVRNGRYFNTPSASTFLKSDSQDYIGEHQAELFRYWSPIFSDASAYLKTGEIPHAIDSDETKRFWSYLTPVLAKRAGAVADFCVEHFEMNQGSPSLLDIGGGAAALYSSAILSANDNAVATQADWPHINEAAATHLSTLGLSGRFSRIDGSLYDDDFGSNNYDFVVLSNIIHLESPESVFNLCAKSANALRQGGRLIISDWIVDDGRTGPSSALYFNFTMALLTPGGRTYEKKEIAQAMKQAGLSGIDFVGTQNNEMIATAVKH